MPFKEPDKEPVIGKSSWDRPGSTLPFLGQRIERVRSGIESLARDEKLGGLPSRERNARVKMLRTSMQLIKRQTLSFAYNRGVANELSEKYDKITMRSRRLKKKKSRRAARNYWLKETLGLSDEWLEEWHLLTDVDSAPYDMTEDLRRNVVVEAKEEYLKKARASAPVEALDGIDAFDAGLAELEDENDLEDDDGDLIDTR